MLGNLGRSSLTLNSLGQVCATPVRSWSKISDKWAEAANMFRPHLVFRSIGLAPCGLPSGTFWITTDIVPGSSSLFGTFRVTLFSFLSPACPGPLAATRGCEFVKLRGWCRRRRPPSRCTGARSLCQPACVQLVCCGRRCSTVACRLWNLWQFRHVRFVAWRVLACGARGGVQENNRRAGRSSQVGRRSVVARMSSLGCRALCASHGSSCRPSVGPRSFIGRSLFLWPSILSHRVLSLSSFF